MFRLSNIYPLFIRNGTFCYHDFCRIHEFHRSGYPTLYSFILSTASPEINVFTPNTGVAEHLSEMGRFPTTIADFERPFSRILSVSDSGNTLTNPTIKNRGKHVFSPNSVRRWKGHFCRQGSAFFRASSLANVSSYPPIAVRAAITALSRVRSAVFQLSPCVK